MSRRGPEQTMLRGDRSTSSRPDEADGAHDRHALRKPPVLDTDDPVALEAAAEAELRIYLQRWRASRPWRLLLYAGCVACVPLYLAHGFSTALVVVGFNSGALTWLAHHFHRRTMRAHRRGRLVMHFELVPPMEALPAARLRAEPRGPLARLRAWISGRGRLTRHGSRARGQLTEPPPDERTIR